MNKFTAVEIEKYTDNDSNISDAPICSFTISVVLVKCFKWEKRLLPYSIINTLNAYKTFLYLSIFLETTDTAKSVSIHAWDNSSTTRIFINQSFVEKHCLNTCKLLELMLIYNINSISNEDSQISEVINVVLLHQLHSEQALLIVSSLNK